MTDTTNPCLGCPATCCSLKGKCGLWLTKNEYETFFKDRAQDLVVRDVGNMVVISSKEGLTCPHLGADGCQIYRDRPIDCRLCPCQMSPVYETRKKVKIMLYMLPDCVENKSFAYPEAEALALVGAFGRMVFGDKEIRVQIFEDKFLPKVKNKCELWAVKLCQKLGINL